MRGRDRFLRFRQDQMQPLGAVASSLDPDVCRRNDAGPAAFGPTLHRCPEIIEREIPLIIRPVEPFGRHPPVPLAPTHIHLPATGLRRPHRLQNFHNAHRHSSVTGAGSLSPEPQPITRKPTNLRLSGFHAKPPMLALRLILKRRLRTRTSLAVFVQAMFQVMPIQPDPGSSYV
ncbi:MAG: hypothetical protein ACD_10C00087G0004 [uncultured bacterium]|nr:MAG: hypothetical protein ACD_10C00087G0004 [uncultured bacterium]